MRFGPLQRSLALLRCPRAPSRRRSRFGVLPRPCGLSLRRWFATWLALPFRSSPRLAVASRRLAWRVIRPCATFFGRDVPDSLLGHHRAWSGVHVRSPTTLMGLLGPSQPSSDLGVPGTRPVQPTCRWPKPRLAFDLFLAEAPAGPVLLLRDRPAGHGLCMPGFWVFPQVSRLVGLSRTRRCCLGLPCLFQVCGRLPQAPHGAGWRAGMAL